MKAEPTMARYDALLEHARTLIARSATCPSNHAQIDTAARVMGLVQLCADYTAAVACLPATGLPERGTLQEAMHAELCKMWMRIAVMAVMETAACAAKLEGA